MDKIVWQLGADSSQVRTEMDKAVSAANRGTAGIATGFGTATRSQDRFLESNNRVTNQVAGFARSLLNARSAADVLASGLDRLENSTNLSLAAGIGLAAGAVVISKISAVREEYHKLQKELEAVHKSASQSGDFKTMSLIEAQAKRAEEAVGKLNDRIAAREGKTGFFSKIGQMFSDDIDHLFKSGMQGPKDQAERAAQYKDQDTLSAQAAAKRQQQTGLRGAALEGTPEYQIKAAQAVITAQEKMAKSLEEGAENFRELNMTIREIVKARNDKAMERSGRSLKETAESLPDVVDNSVTWEQYQASQQAKKALTLRGQGETARMAGDAEAAHGLFNQAGEAAEGITGLKPSEKMSVDLKGALAVSEEKLTEIATNTAKQFVNQ